MTGWFFWAFGITAGLAMFSSLMFARLAMKNIENKIIALGHQRPCSWDTLGVRSTFYAYGIVLPEKHAARLEKLYDVSLVRSIATKRDRLLSIFFLTSWFFFISLLTMDAIFRF